MILAIDIKSMLCIVGCLVHYLDLLSLVTPYGPAAIVTFKCAWRHAFSSFCEVLFTVFTLSNVVEQFVEVFYVHLHITRFWPLYFRHLANIKWPSDDDDARVMCELSMYFSRIQSSYPRVDHSRAPSSQWSVHSPIRNNFFFSTFVSNKHTNAQLIFLSKALFVLLDVYS